jgi:DNA-binding CsgD family transcriptional regulator
MLIQPNQTLHETMDDLDFKLFNLEKKHKEHQFNLSDIGDFLPVGLLINHKNGSNLYMNKYSEQTLNLTSDEVKALGREYQNTILYDAEEYERIKAQIDRFFERKDETEVLSFFQRIRPYGQEEYEWMYITSKLFKRDSEKDPEERLMVACPVSMMGDMTKKVNRVLEENVYMKKNFNKFARLTRREKEVLSLVAQGYNTPSIADMLFISPHTVEQHRKNINYKIETNSFAELIRFAIAFDLAG